MIFLQVRIDLSLIRDGAGFDRTGSLAMVSLEGLCESINKVCVLKLCPVSTKTSNQSVKKLFKQKKWCGKAESVFVRLPLKTNQQ